MRQAPAPRVGPWPSSRVATPSPCRSDAPWPWCSGTCPPMWRRERNPQPCPSAVVSSSDMPVGEYSSFGVGLRFRKGSIATDRAAPRLVGSAARGTRFPAATSARATARETITRRSRGRAGGPEERVAKTVPPSGSVGRRLRQRSAHGAFQRGGSPGRTLPSGGMGPARGGPVRPAHSDGERGGAPRASRTGRTRARRCRSGRRACAAPYACSGLMYVGVRWRWPVAVSWSRPAALMARAIPKSATSACPTTTAGCSRVSRRDAHVRAYARVRGRPRSRGDRERVGERQGRPRG